MTSKKGEKRKNLNLFEDEDEDANEDHFDDDDDQAGEEYDLNIEGKLNRSESKSAKLIELQSKFAYDSRFKIDDRFIDDEEDDHEPKNEIEEEKSKNLAILEDVLGKKFRHSKPVDPVTEFRKSKLQPNKRHSGQSYVAINSVLTPRFDPTKAESKIYEIPDNDSVTKRKVNIDFDELDRKEENDRKKKLKTNSTSQPETNKDSPKKLPLLTENYYEVSTNLKESLADGGEFSIGSLLGFGSVEEETVKAVIEANEKATYEPIKNADKKKMSMLRNPFKYDSSDEEDEAIERIKWGEQEEGSDAEEEEEVVVDKDLEDGQMEPLDEEEEQEVKIKITPPPPPKFPTAFAGFFFKLNDPRLRDEDPAFYNPQLVEKIRANGKERSLVMMRALSLRKRAAMKNLKGDKKFAEKLKLKRKLKGKAGLRRRGFHRFNYSRNSNANPNRHANNVTNKPTATATNENKV